MMKASYDCTHIDWNGIRIEIRYCPNWMNCNFVVHLEIESVHPEKAPLPVTETGYLSHFTQIDVIDGAGGPAAFVRAWLDKAAKDPEWLAAEAARKQLSLF